jgi:hypothetical protein
MLNVMETFQHSTRRQVEEEAAVPLGASFVLKWQY